MSTDGLRARHPLKYGTPPEAWPALVRLLRAARRPLERFLHIEAASGVGLLAATAIALVWANSPWAQLYERVWHTPLAISVGSVSFGRDLAWIVNDGLMVVFFFVVGVEIRRELHSGELSDWRRAPLPAIAALGGMIVPAFVYLALAWHPAARPGWGVPMATDVAFAVGVLTLLGKRVPAALRVLLLALAVIDDLGAILVIAVFYSAPGSLAGILVATLACAGIVAMQRFGVRAKAAYLVPGFVVWAGIYAAGVHPTIAGVLVGLLTPVRAWLGTEGFVADVRKELARLSSDAPSKMPPRELAARLRRIDLARREAMSPAASLIETLHPWVAFGVMPLFALANAGVVLHGAALEDAPGSVAIAVSAGLLLGKPLGVLLASLAAVRLRIAALPTGVTTRHLVVLGIVAGIGFTMSLFIAQLAFTEGPLLSAAKLAVLAASGVAATLALVTGRGVLQPTTAKETADEAEHVGDEARARP